MFWTIFSTLCADKNLSPNAVATELKIPSGSITAWRNGATPRTKSLTKISNYFGVTVDYLLNAEKENAPGKDDNGNTYSTLYAHMNSAPVVSVGQPVEKGKVLGYVGSTGNSTGNHLHLEMKVNNVLVNVMNYLS